MLFTISYIKKSHLPAPNVQFYYVPCNVTIEKTEDTKVNTANDNWLEAVIRMPKTHVKRLFCDFIRTASLFWDPTYGPITLILDEEDKDDKFFPGNFLNLSLPFKFQLEFEPPAPNKERFASVAKRGRARYPGYLRQLYSSHLMDLYTKSPIIAWFDTDVYLTSLITKDRILNNGKLLNKGMNFFSGPKMRKQGLIPIWDEQTLAFLGVRSVSNFMSYFPVMLWRSTIKNCREYIMKRFKGDKWDEVFFDATEQALTSIEKLGFDTQGQSRTSSPVIILMTYAYFFEHDKYEWHLDLMGDSLENHNKRFAGTPFKISEFDLSPELHSTIHKTWNSRAIQVLTNSVCHTHKAKDSRKVPSHCSNMDKPHMDLFMFEDWTQHFEGWCRGQVGKELCSKLIRKHYEDVGEVLRGNDRLFNTSHIRVIENMALEYYQIKCLPFQY